MSYIWDFAAEERFRFLLPQYIGDANGATIVYDAIDAKSLKNVSNIIEIGKKIIKLKNKKHYFYETY